MPITFKEQNCHDGILCKCPDSQHVGGFGECSYRAGCFPGLPRQAAAFKEELGSLITDVGGHHSQSYSSG